VVTPGIERLWVVGKTNYLIAPDGTVLWDTTATDDGGPVIIPDFLAGAAKSELLVATWGKHVVGYRAADQALLWTSQVAPSISWLVPATITADGGCVLAKRTADTLFVFRAADGEVLRFFLDPDTAADKRVFVAGTVPVGDRYHLPTVKRLAAYDTAASLLWLTEDNGGP
jgi:outer membrane protein assembly factor BamB